MTIREKVMSEISEFPDSKLYAIQGYINFLDSSQERQNFDDDSDGEPLDDFDYELALRAEACKNEETVSHEELLKKCGIVRAKI